MKIAFDTKEMKPGCAIIQAVYGGDLGIANRFPVESWLIHPTPDMATYEIPPEQLDYLVAKVKADE